MLRKSLKSWVRTRYAIRNPIKIYEYREINRRLRSNRDGVLLDLGCGAGLQAVLLSRRFHKTIGVDLSCQQIQAASERVHRWNRERIAFLCGDLLDLSFDSESLNAVVSFSVLEHIPHWRDILVELYRVLTPGGQLVISVDSLENIEDGRLVRKHRNDHSVQHYFSADELAAQLRGLGFRRVEVWPLFTSTFSQQLFSKGIENKFQFTRVESLLGALRLRLSEPAKGDSPRGVFLLADATK